MLPPPIHDTFIKKNFKLTKDAYAAQHKDELDAFNKAVRTLMKLNGSTAVDLEKFLRAQGETLVRSGKEYRWKAHDSLTVCGNKWFRHSQSKDGMY